MTDKIIQEYSDELNKAADELNSAFKDHVQPIINEMFAITEKIEDEGADDEFTIREHLAALWRYIAIIEKIYQHMRDKAIRLVERLKK